MPTQSIVIIAVSVLVVFELVFVFGLVIPALVRSNWNILADDHPPVEPAPDAVVKRWQSFKAGMLNLGWSVDVTVDERYLHMGPSPLGRLIRLRAASVPWEAIRFVRAGRFSATVAVGGVTLHGPKWCLTMAQVAED